MLHFELIRDRKILVLTPHGPLQKEDFENLAMEVDPFIESNGDLAGVMICTESFPGRESFAALASHLKFVADHHRKVKRVAVVTNSDFLKTIPRIADHFVLAEVKHFAFDEKAKALAWIEAGE